jgi:hypothetical protein
MANALYDKGREKFLTGSISWTTDTIKLVFVDGADYTPNLATHEFLSHIPAAGRVAISGAFTGKTATNGVADADDVTVTNVTGDQFEYIIIFKDTGNEATSPLIAFLDTVTGLPFTPSGSDVTVRWNDGPNKIFKL